MDPVLRGQAVTPQELASMGFRGIITNAYILKKHVGEVADVHKHLSFDGVVMTDSGAYQVLRYGSVEVGNREIVEYQCRVGSDIAVILDVPTRCGVSEGEARASAEETYRRAVEAAEAVRGCRGTLWVLPIQGGAHLNVLREYAEKSVGLWGAGYELFGLGSPTTLLEQYMFEVVLDMIFTVRSVIPPAAPLHLFGAGHPLIVPFAVALGVDLMDSASYVLYARDGRYMTRRGTYKLEDLEELPCACPVCSRHGEAQALLELPGEERVRALALHNLYVLLSEVRSVREAIREGRLWEYLEERAHAHPAARRAFERLKRYVEHLYKHSPTMKRGKAVFILGLDSVYNPKVMMARRRVLNRVAANPARELIFVPLKGGRRPQHLGGAARVYVYELVLGVAPLSLACMYPYSQHELAVEPTRDAVMDLAYYTFEVILRHYKAVRNSDPLRIKLCFDESVEWQREFAYEVAKLVAEGGLRAEVSVEPLGATATCA